MAPAKTARAPAIGDDRLNDAALAKKLAQASGSGRGRKPNGTSTTVDKGKEAAALANGSVADHNLNTTTQSSAAKAAAWSSSSTDVLHAYRRSYRLSTPAAHHNPHAHTVLQTGIGRFSPTMARPRAQRRVPKDQLALAVRKHFNSLPVNENEVIVDLLYHVKTKEKSLRLKFPATKGR